MRIAIPIVLLLIATEARAANLIAVLPLDLRHAAGKINGDAEAAIEEMLRDATANALGPEGWTVLTGENTLQILADNGIDATKCGEENCHLAAARELKADLFISGAIEWSDGEFTGSIRLLDSKSGRILASAWVSGPTAKALRTDFAGKANEFFDKGIEATPGGLRSGTPENASPPKLATQGPTKTTEPVTKAVGTLIVTAKPKGLVSLDMISPHGASTSAGAPYQNTQAMPGRWKVTARATGYEDETQEIDVETDAVKAINFELLRYGGLTVTGEPAGAAVNVTGPKGFKDEGGLPAEWTNLRHGTYQVRVSRQGYVDQEQTVEVVPENTSSVRITLVHGSNASRFTATADTVQDRTTGLVWQRVVKVKGYEKDAATYCSHLDLGGFNSGWRLPTASELMSLVDRTRITGMSPAIDPSAFPPCCRDPLWTSTPSQGGGPLVVDFYVGATTEPTGANAIRCVRKPSER